MQYKFQKNAKSMNKSVFDEKMNFFIFLAKND